MKFYRDGVRIGRLVIRWWGWAGTKRARLGLAITRDDGPGSFSVIGGLWWLGFRVEWWLE